MVTASSSEDFWEDFKDFLGCVEVVGEIPTLTQHNELRVSLGIAQKCQQHMRNILREPDIIA